MARESVIDLEPLVKAAPLSQESLDFRYAGRATKALLIVTVGGHAIRFAAAESRDSVHAEANLLESKEWKTSLVEAAKAKPGVEMVIYVLVSRAPCHGVLTDASGRLLEPAEARRYGLREAERISKAGGAVRVRPGCASKLAEAIRPFRDSSKSNLRFVLACRGTYEPTAEGTRVGVGTTTNSDVKNLIAAGWDVRAVRIDGGLSLFGQQLSTFVGQL